MRAQLDNDLSDILLPRVRQRLDLKDEVMSIQVARCPCVELGVGRKEKGQGYRILTFLLSLLRPTWA